MPCGSPTPSLELVHAGSWAWPLLVHELSFTLSHSALLSSLSGQLPSRTPRLLAGLTVSTRASPTAELSPTVLLCRPQAPNAHLAGCHALPELLLN